MWSHALRRLQRLPHTPRHMAAAEAAKTRMRVRGTGSRPQSKCSQSAAHLDVLRRTCGGCWTAVPPRRMPWRAGRDAYYQLIGCDRCMHGSAWPCAAAQGCHVMCVHRVTQRTLAEPSGSQVTAVTPACHSSLATAAGPCHPLTRHRLCVSVCQCRDRRPGYIQYFYYV